MLRPESHSDVSHATTIRMLPFNLAIMMNEWMNENAYHAHMQCGVFSIHIMVFINKANNTLPQMRVAMPLFSSTMLSLVLKCKKQTNKFDNQTNV